jgi:hypothetical protein
MRVNVIRVAPAEGVQWLKRAWALTRANPLAVHAGFFGYLVLVLVTGAIPVLGQILPLIAVPVFYVGVMALYRAVANQQPLTPALLLSGFSPTQVAVKLLLMGVLYALTIGAIFWLASLVDGGALMRLASGQEKLDPKSIDQAAVTTGMAVALLLYVPATWLFWLAPQFVAWHGMGVGKALFFSWVGCVRNIGAFVAFFAATAVLLLAAALIASAIGLLFGGPGVAQALMLPVSLLFGVVLYVAFYVSYESMVREEPAVPTEQAPPDQTPT